MNKEKLTINHKWGFGHAPLKSKTALKNKKAVLSFLKHINDETTEIDLDEISLVKGLINRCIRKDQWDWFTIYTLLGRPERDELISILPLIMEYRNAVKFDEVDKLQNTKKKLIDKNILFLLENYLGKRKVDLEGYIYILSRREDPDILKIGMTTRDVEVRLKEINSATGVLYPYSVRIIIKVEKPKEAENCIFEELDDFRIRKDREFFNIEFKVAINMINKCLKSKGFI